MKKQALTFLFLIFGFQMVFAQSKSTVRIGLMKYKGGGDWYANPTALPNLARFCNQVLGMDLSTDIDEVEPGSSALFNYPFVHMTGHGNVVFSTQEAKNLRTYLLSGGFLHISDNYGMDPYIRKEMKKVFPELDFVELPFDHPVYQQKFRFTNGVPKIHEHEGKPAQGLALVWQGRVVCFYDFECDLGDGWEDQSVHNDAEAVRTKALQMGANLIQYALTN